MSSVWISSKQILSGDFPEAAKGGAFNSGRQAPGRYCYELRAVVPFVEGTLFGVVEKGNQRKELLGVALY